MLKKSKQKQIEYNPVCEPSRMHGYTNVRFVENVSEGLRLVGFADEIARSEGYPRSIDHRGWYTQDDGWNGEVYRGVVYQLSARDGKPQFAYGYADPNNDGCALLCFDLDVKDKLEAARYADDFARIFAEEERDYQRAWQAGRDYEDLGEKVAEMRSEALAIAAEMREAKAKIEGGMPAICATLRGKILSLYRSIQKARKERKELLDNYGREPGFVE